MNKGHIDFQKLLADGTATVSTQGKKHLENCPLCRRQYQMCSAAERGLGGDLDSPSPHQAETLLSNILLASEQTTARPWWPALLKQRWWLPTLVAASLVIWLTLPSAPPKNEYASKGAVKTSQLGVRAFCVYNNKAQTLNQQEACPQGGNVAVSIFAKTDFTGRAFLYCRDSVGTLHRASTDDPTVGSQGLWIDTKNQDSVLEAHIKLNQIPLGEAQLIVALCSSCSEAEIKSQLVEGDSPDIHIERIPIRVTKELP